MLSEATQMCRFVLGLLHNSWGVRARTTQPFLSASLPVGTGGTGGGANRKDDDDDDAMHAMRTRLQGVRTYWKKE